MSKITLLTACYNSSATVADTMLSVNAQTYPHLEHIIIDGDSTDDTIEIIEKTGRRVKKIVSEPDNGIYDAYNKGITYANGDIIGFINSDDFYSRADVISQVMEVFEDREIQACHADLVYVDPINTNKIGRYWKSQHITKKALEKGFIPAHPTVFLRKEVYEKIGNFNLKYRYAADYEFLLRAFYKHEIKSIYQPDIWVRMRTGGHTGGTLASIKAQNDEILKAQKNHGIECSQFKFYANKIFDRTMQRVRAPFTSVPNILDNEENHD